MKPLMKIQHEPTAPVDEAAYSGSVLVPASRLPAPALNRISSAPLACRTFGTLLNFVKTVRLDYNDLRGKGWDTVPNLILAPIALVRGCPGLQRTSFRTVGRPLRGRRTPGSLWKRSEGYARSRLRSFHP